MDGYAAINRKWKSGDKIDLFFKLEPRVVAGDHKNEGKVAVLYGPLVLAADEALLPSTAGRPLSLNSVSAAGTDLAALQVSPESAPGDVKSWPYAEVFRVNGIIRKDSGDVRAGMPAKLKLVPFADAGGAGSRYKVWLPVGLAAESANVLFEGQESRSREGNVSGSIADGDERSFVVTFDGKGAKEDWFAVAPAEPAIVTRVAFAHGGTFHDGGWFDASAGKPRVQVKPGRDAGWQTVGALKDYPATTATDSAGLQGGQRFTCELAKPMEVFAIRVTGQPAHGDNPQQSFSSCAELQVFGK